MTRSIPVAIHPRSRQVVDEAKVLAELAVGRGLRRHAFFFVTDEGEVMPNGVEDASGYVIDEQGRIYAFWLGWNASEHVPTFTEWEEVAPEPAWAESAEYRQARTHVGLG
jgi:hypothetical protein